MTHFDILMGVNWIFHDLEAFPFNVCFYEAAVSYPQTPSVLLSSMHPRLLERSAHAWSLTVDFNAGLRQPLGRARTASLAFSRKPLKASFSREWEEASGWRLAAWEPEDGTGGKKIKSRGSRKRVWAPNRFKMRSSEVGAAEHLGVSLWGNQLEARLPFQILD